MTTFLRRPNPIVGESLTSLIYRVAAYNKVSPFDVWKLMIPNNHKKPMSSMSQKLNLYPHILFDLRKFESFLMLPSNKLNSLSFLPLFEKFGIYIDDIPSSNFLYSLIHKHLKFCPECLKENSSHKLIWQVKEINYCDTHKIELVSACWNCNMDIPMLSADSFIDRCPYCNYELKNSVRCTFIPNDLELRAFHDWSYLLNEERLLSESAIATPQSTALKLLYISKNFETNTSKADLYKFQ